MSEIIGVVGAGTMVGGIAQVAARSGCRVILRDVKDEFLVRGMKAINSSLQRDVDKERLQAEEKTKIIERIETTTEWNKLAEARPSQSKGIYTVWFLLGERSKELYFNKLF